MEVAHSTWESAPWGPGVRLIAEDRNGLAALDKPAGILSHPNSPADASRSLLRCEYDRSSESFFWTEPDGRTQRLWLLNRLDSATSGVILLARGEELATAVRKLFALRRVEKVYNALVFGVPAQEKEIWRDLLTVDKKQGRIRTSGKGALPAESGFRRLRTWRDPMPVTLCELRPKTGRSHQLRVQCQRRNLPIVGDQTYGSFRLNREFLRLTGEKRLFLHSLETQLSYTLRGRTFTFCARAPLPEAFLRGPEPATD